MKARLSKGVGCRVSGWNCLLEAKKPHTYHHSPHLFIHNVFFKQVPFNT
ncbi:hypothetical protein [Coleofasciculus sp. E2-BRE-01]